MVVGFSTNRGEGSTRRERRPRHDPGELFEDYEPLEQMREMVNRREDLYASQPPPPPRAPRDYMEEQLEWYFEQQKRKPNPITPKLRELARGNPVLKARIKDYVLKKRDLEEAGRKYGVLPPMVMTRTLEKRESPGKFVVPVIFEDIFVEHALVDTGASINVMPTLMLKELGIRHPMLPSNVIALADASLTQPRGRLVDYPLRVGNCIIPTDFVVVDMSDSKKLSLLLGTPFLNTAGGVIDFVNRHVTLTRVDRWKCYKMVSDDYEYCNASNEDPIEDPGDEVNDLCEGLAELFKDQEGELIQEAPTTKNKKKRAKKAKAKARPRLEMDNGKMLNHFEGMFNQYKKVARRDGPPPTMTLRFKDYEEGVATYFVQCEGMPKLYSECSWKLRNSVMERGMKFINELVCRTFKFEMTEEGPTYLRGSSSPNA